MTIKNDLSSLKVGDKVFSIGKGEETIQAIDNTMRYSVKTKSDAFMTNGMRTSEDKHPSLFLSAKHASEYFASLKEKKQIHVKYYVHDLLDNKGFEYAVISCNITIPYPYYDKYLGYTEVNKTYEIEE